MFSDKPSVGAMEKAVGRSVNFELTIADLARRAERRAWWVAACAIAMTLVLAGGYFYLLPLKEKVPYIVMADAYTGTSTVARLTEDFTNRHISSSEAINRSNVAHFVLARESYDAAMLKLRDWTTTLTMASPGVAAAYTALYRADKSDNPSKVYGENRAIRVKILSIVLIGNGAGMTPKGATVRFQRSLYNKQTGVSDPMDNKLATLEFAYKPNLQMDDQNRIENPLGFQVTGYRVDNDYDSTPPIEVIAAGLPSTDDVPPDHEPRGQTLPPASDVANGLRPATTTRPAALVAPPPSLPQVPSALAVPRPPTTANGVGR